VPLAPREEWSERFAGLQDKKCSLCGHPHPSVGLPDAKCKACKCPDKHTKHTCGLSGLQSMLSF
jgi:hypothetical protein